jgi:hypothetical protein
VGAASLVDAETRGEVRVLDQFGQLDPGVDLLGGWIVGKLGHRRAQHGHQVGVGVQVSEGLADRVERIAVHAPHLPASTSWGLKAISRLGVTLVASADRYDGSDRVRGTWLLGGSKRDPRFTMKSLFMTNDVRVSRNAVHGLLANP